MRIRCERCATTYELDEKRLPPHGGMVKCTRCQHVFRAAPPGPGAAPAEVPAPPRTPAAPGNGSDGVSVEKTAVFGFSAPGEPEGTASLGSAAPSGGGTVAPKGGSAGAPARTGAGPGGGRRWVWVVLALAVVGAVVALLLR